ncbi:cytidine deaminase-like protein [Hypomontagnella monticulosa]|nr:cytidine deaminase-like protein [Hypomontagnella monticulosa]
MAGHKISGYAASLWQVLFASFIQLFTRIFSFSRTTESPQEPSQPPQDQKQQKKQQKPLSPSTTSEPDSSSLCNLPPHPPTLQQEQEQHQQLQQQHHHSFIDLEQGIESSSQHHSTMPSKKRGGQKRGGPKGNAARYTGPYTGPSNGTSNKPTPSQSPAPPPASQRPSPAGVTTIANQGDTGVNSRDAKDQAPTGPGSDGPSCGPLQPTSLGDYGKENATASKISPSVSQSQSPALKPLVTENQTQPQRTGTRSQHATTASTSSNKPDLTENTPPSKQIDQISVGVSSLNLNDLSSTEETSKAKPAPIIPKVVTVAIPLPLTNGAASPDPNTSPAPNLPGLIEPKTEEERIERAYHLKFMEEALSMGTMALNTNETPVGCVLVYHGRVIAKGMNATNNTRNGTRHAEFMALSALLSRKEPGDVKDVDTDPALDDACWGDVDPTDGHIYPYGQKLHPAPVVNRSIISECVLYVTVEPCVMCASLLRQLGIKKVYFGAVNDKFGGTGGVFKIHLNSKPVPRPDDRPYMNGYGPQDTGRINKGRAAPLPRDEDDGDGGNVESGYPVEGGYLRDEAVSLLRRFYVQENNRAPQPRKKDGRAARLLAMENQAKNGGSASDLSDTGTLPDAPVDAEAAADDDEDGEIIATTNGNTPIMSQ